MALIVLESWQRQTLAVEVTEDESRQAIYQLPVRRLRLATADYPMVPLLHAMTFRHDPFKWDDARFAPVFVQETGQDWGNPFV